MTKKLCSFCGVYFDERALMEMRSTAGKKLRACTPCAKATLVALAQHFRSEVVLMPARVVGPPPAPEAKP